MTARDTTHLIFVDDGCNARKFWSATLDGPLVTVRFGRIGAAGQTRSNSHGSHEAARVAYAKAVREKLVKGYVRAEGGASSAAADAPRPTIGVPKVRPMLAEEIDVNDLVTYIEDDLWVTQQKVDGDHVMLAVTDGQVHVIGRDGQTSKHSSLFARLNYADVARLPDCVVDGELVDKTLILFDLPVYAAEGVSLNSPYAARLDGLERLFVDWAPNENFRLLRTARTHADKAQLAIDCLNAGAEGVMLKALSGTYMPGRRVRTVLKAKFVKELDAYVSEVGREGKEDYILSLYRDGRPVEVGGCSAIGKVACVVGDVVTVRFLYLGANGRLYQPRMIRKRTDKAVGECLWSQLACARVGKEVLA